MKILFISDIHGITNNLGYIYKLNSDNDFDKIIVLGDFYYTGPTYKEKYSANSIEVLDFLNSFKDKVVGVKGNCDSDVDLKNSDFPINDELILNIDNLNIYCTHGNNYSESKGIKYNKSNILIYGHEHIPYIHQKDNITYICVGSISLPKSNTNPTYLIFENRKFTIFDIYNNVVDEIKL